jgi:hypothetical protein
LDDIAEVRRVDKELTLLHLGGFSGAIIAVRSP